MPAVAAAADDSSIAGAVIDENTKEPLRGAIVWIECMCLQSRIETQTNDSGLYVASNLPAGLYTVRVFKGKANVDKTFELPRAAKFRANFKMDPQDKIRRPILVRKPAVDSRSTTTGRVMDAQEWAKVPTSTNRTHIGVAEAVPTAQQTTGGLIMGGGTPTDIKYTLGESSLNSPRFSTVTAGILQDFLSEIEVLEAGYDAEYGDASTGQVRTRRQSGSNRFRGSARFTYTPRLAKPREISETTDTSAVAHPSSV